MTQKRRWVSWRVYAFDLKNCSQFFSSIDSWDESCKRKNEMTNIFNWLSIFLSIFINMIWENDIDELDNRCDW